MLNKMERFQQWRGDKASAEQHFLSSALLISDYVDSVTELDVIKANAEAKFKEFDKYKERSWGTIIFSKLFIEEAIAQLPDTAHEEKEILAHASTILSSLFDNWKLETKKNIAALLEDVEKLLVLGELHFPDKKSYQAFIFSAYMLCQIINVSLGKLDWGSQMVVGMIFNVEQLKGKIAHFLQKIEERAIKLKQLTLVPAAVDLDPLKPTKDLLNQRYFKVLVGNPLKMDATKEIRNQKASKFYAPMAKLHQVDTQKLIRRDIMTALSGLEMDITKVSSSISSVLDLRGQKTEIEGKITLIQTLLLAVEENDQRVTGRKYFHDFITSHADAYQVLLENTEEKLRDPFVNKTNQLKSAVESPDLSSEVLNGMSWVAAPLTLVYRTATPQMVQDVVKAKLLPSTLDGVCKMELHELAKTCLGNLQEKLKKKEQQITAINNRVFRQDEALKRLISTQSSERLGLLLKANDAMNDAVRGSCQLLVTVKENLHFLNDLKEKSNVLNEFIRVHDGFFVKITNFLAQFFSLFKTKTAKMIDKASALKKQVDELATEYQKTVDQEMLRIENDTHLDKKIKNHLKKQFFAEETEMNQEKIERFSPSKHNVRLLMNSLSQLFASNPHPILGKKQIDEEDHRDVAILVCS